MESLFIERIRKLSRPLDPLSTGMEASLVDLKGIRAVIFDVYGTCFVSGSGDIGLHAASPKVEALSMSLREQGVEAGEASAREGMDLFYELITRDHEACRMTGVEYPEIRILDIWEQWRRETGLRVNVPQLAIDVECRLNPVWPMPGLAACLDGLRAMDITLGIVSNAQVFTPCLFPALTERTLDDFGFSARNCVWSWRLREAKPSTRPYGSLLERMEGMDPGVCLYVGNDMRNDIAPASEMGMKTALFAGDRRSLRLREGDPLVEGVKPDVVLTRLTQLLECV